jgi:hypothetical protein
MLPDGEAKENTAFIAHAANCHADLLAALNAALECITNPMQYATAPDFTPANLARVMAANKTVEMLQATITKAESPKGVKA